MINIEIVKFGNKEVFVRGGIRCICLLIVRGVVVFVKLRIVFYE